MGTCVEAHTKALTQRLRRGMGRSATIGFIAMLGGLALFAFYVTRNPLALFPGLILLVVARLLIRKPRR